MSTHIPSPLWEPDPGPAPSGGGTPIPPGLTRQFSSISPCPGRWSGAPGQQCHLWLDMRRRWDPEDWPASWQLSFLSLQSSEIWLTGFLNSTSILPDSGLGVGGASFNKPLEPLASQRLHFGGVGRGGQKCRSGKLVRSREPAGHGGAPALRHYADKPLKGTPFHGMCFMSRRLEHLS